MRIKAILSLCLFTLATAVSADEFIKINTDQVGLVLRAADNGRLYQSYLGKRLANESDLQHLPKGNEAYLTHGMEDYFEPAIEVHHNDANPSSLLKYVSHTSKNVQPGVDETVITLQDDKYQRKHYQNLHRNQPSGKETAETGTLCFCHAALQPAGLLSDGVFRRLDL